VSNLTGVAPWQIADVLALAKVCFEGKNGHDADAGQCPLMTQSGHFEIRCHYSAAHWTGLPLKIVTKDFC
jgi:hypothetical protein